MSKSPSETLVSVRNLAVEFRAGQSVTRAVNGISFTIGKGETVALVGESGSGKSVSALSIMRLLSYPAASHPTGEIFFEGRDLLAIPEPRMREVRGSRISIIFQEPMTSLNPLHTIEKQLGEIIKQHGGGKVGTPILALLLNKLAGGASGGGGRARAPLSAGERVLVNQVTSWLDLTGARSALRLAGLPFRLAMNAIRPRARELHAAWYPGEVDRRKNVLALLESVGIRDALNRLDAYPHQLSGGQRQRVMIAMALANEPDLLIADEPTTALDVTIQAQILELLKTFQRERGMAMLLITHDLGIVRKMAERVYVMNKGDIVEEGPAQRIFDAPQHPYTRHLLAAEPTGKPPAGNPSGPVVIEIDNLKVWFPIKRGLMRRTVDHVKAVDGLSLRLRAGETLGVVGESGSGKTTLGQAILRLVSSEGPITYSGRRIDGLSTKAMRPLRREMQVVFQDPYGSLSPRLSVSQIIEEGLIIQSPSMSFEERRERVGQALTEVGLDPAAQDRYPHEFSGGQRQRIAIARAMVLEPKFVMLDEPTSALDMSVQAQIVDLLRDLQKKRDLAYLFISHDLRVVRALCNYVIVMRNGRVVEEGPSAEIFERPKEDYTKALLAAALNLEVIHRSATAT